MNTNQNTKQKLYFDVGLFLDAFDK